MNRKEWKILCKVDKGKARFWYNKTRKKLLSKEFESDERTDKDAKVIHHLRDTEEQRNYNDEHYELFGFEVDENGNESFTYGKYVVFWTREHHTEYHKCSEETRKKISESLKGRIFSESHRKNLSNSLIGHSVLEETREKLRIASAGHTHSEETKFLISEASKEHWANSDYREKVIASSKESWKNDEARRLATSNRFKGKRLSEEHKQKLREANSGENNPMYGTHPSAETLEKRSKAISAAMTEDVRRRISAHMPDRHGENNPMYGKTSAMNGKHHSEETRKKISDNTKAALDNPEVKDRLSAGGKKGGKIALERSIQYEEYKNTGGTLRWNEFQSALKENEFSELVNSLHKNS